MNAPDVATLVAELPLIIPTSGLRMLLMKERLKRSVRWRMKNTVMVNSPMVDSISIRRIRRSSSVVKVGGNSLLNRSRSSWEQLKQNECEFLFSASVADSLLLWMQ